MGINGKNKRLHYFSLCIMLSIAPLPFVNAAPNDPVSIPDAILRGVIEAELGKSPGDTITEMDMEGVTHITGAEAQDKGIADLTGLEYAINLQALDLNNLTSAAPNNSVTDLTPLRNLTKLTELHLGNRSHRSPKNDITDLTPLSTVTTLTTLNLQRHDITNLTPLRPLTALSYLNLKQNYNLTDISTLQYLTALTVLDIPEMNFPAASLGAVLPTLTKLVTLTIYSTNISDLRVISDNLTGMNRTPLSLLSMELMGPPPYQNPSAGYDGGGFVLKDLSPLVSMLNSGKFATTAAIILHLNFNLDYESLFEHIPTLLARGITFGSQGYSPVAPGLERESAEEGRGRPGTQYTFVVHGYNVTDDWRPVLWNLPQFFTAQKRNDNFGKMPVTWTVTEHTGTGTPQGTTETVETDDEGLARFTITLGAHDEVHTVTAIVPANTRPAAEGPSHPKLEVSFTVTADRTLPPPPGTEIETDTEPEPEPEPETETEEILPDITVSFEDYPEEPPIGSFPLTIQFSEPVSGFEKEDITVEMEMTRGRGDPATIEELTPETPGATYTVLVAVPPRASGIVILMVKKESVESLNPGRMAPPTDTFSDPIEFRRRRRSVFPSHLPMDIVVFNEFRNASDDTHDWVELKNISDEDVSLKEWEVSLVTPEKQDVRVAAFPDWTLAKDDVLLIVNTDPSETDLIRGQDIENPNYNPQLRPRYLIAPEMQLPTRFLLVLRSQREKTGTWFGFEDVTGDYHREDVGFRTQIWPLRDTWVYTGTQARYEADTVYKRIMRPQGAIPRTPIERGYHRESYRASEYHDGLGYNRDASPETSLGTPGYTTSMEVDVPTGGSISISEIMFLTDQGGPPWIELYNSSSSEIVNLQGWTLMLEGDDGKNFYHYTGVTFRSLQMMPNATVLIVAQRDRHSQNIPRRQIYNLKRKNRKALFLRSEGFAMRLFSPDGALVDRVGNLNGRRGRDRPLWTVPTVLTEGNARSSLIRRYEDRVPAQGTHPKNWVRAAETSLIGPYTYYGYPTDHGTPGYRQGSPLPVTLSSFRADREEDAVVVKWTTASEMDNAGFYVMRRQEKGTGFR